METKKCECGCGSDIPKYTKRGKKRRFVTGHYSRVQNRDKNKHSENIMIECACGCGEKINSFDKRGRSRRYIKGHTWNKQYDSALEQARAWRKKNSKKNNKSQFEWRRKRKIKLIKLFDSKCNECGVEYNNTNGAIFQFHHLDGTTKKFNLGIAKMGLSWKKILTESKKCVMVCANCHSLRHSKEF